MVTSLDFRRIQGHLKVEKLRLGLSSSSQPFQLFHQYQRPSEQNPSVSVCSCSFLVALLGGGWGGCSGPQPQCGGGGGIMFLFPMHKWLFSNVEFKYILRLRLTVVSRTFVISGWSQSEAASSCTESLFSLHIPSTHHCLDCSSSRLKKIR